MQTTPRKMSRNEHLLNLNILPDCQHRFRHSCSVTTQLLETFNDVSWGLEDKKISDIIYFDFSKAFDKIPQDNYWINFNK